MSTKGARPIRAPRGDGLRDRGWQPEAVLRPTRAVA